MDNDDYDFKPTPYPGDPEPMPDFDLGHSPPVAAPYAGPDTINGEIEVTSGIVPLGHDRGIHYYLSRATGQVHALSPAEHTPMNLRNLGTEAQFWATTMFKSKKSVRWDDAADFLIQASHAEGIFIPERLRGRGAWREADGRVVLNLGNQLIVDGAPIGTMKLNETSSVYETGQKLTIALSYTALPTEHATRFLHLCRALPWTDNEASGTILAGWLVTALICGAMPWRPHIWLTGEAAGGKSYVIDKIIRHVLGRLCLAIQSKTTEAGIRQTLGRDALAVVFDEAETQNDRDRERFQSILDLARQASTEDGAQIVKGTPGGIAKTFHIRSMFCFSSINVALSQAADESRSLVLNLEPNPDHATRAYEFIQLQAMREDVLTDDFSAQLLTRIISMTDVIRANAITFAEAIARAGNSRRTGDTLGAVLAGAWALQSHETLTPDHAARYVAQNPWINVKIDGQKQEPEWDRATQRLLAHRIRVINRHTTAEDVPIGELIQIIKENPPPESPITAHEAAIALARVHIRLTKNAAIFIGHNSIAAEAAFRGTPWAAPAWRATIARTPGAKSGRDVVTQRFGIAVERGVEIPVG